MKIIITGTNGFVGSHLISFFSIMDIDFIIISSQHKIVKGFSYDAFFNDEICCDNVIAFIHLAGAAHQNFTDKEAKELNFDLTKKIIDKCVDYKIPKFIFLSTVNVYKGYQCVINLSSQISKGLRNTASTKLLAENYIRLKSSEGLIESVIIRSPLVYGEGVKANFSNLFNFIGKCYPLPFGLIVNNKQSLISVYNLVDLIYVCVVNPKSKNQIFLVSDDDDLSTTKMVRLIAKVQGVKPWLLPVPVWLLKLTGKLTGKSNMISRLTDSFQVDITHTKDTLDWTPPYSVEEGFAKCVQTPRNKKTLQTR